MLNQIKTILTYIIEPFTQPETYTKLATNIIMILIYIVVAWVAIKVINKIIAEFFKMHNKSKKGNKKRSKTLVSLIQNIVKYIIWFIIVTTILSKFGISVEGIIASAGVVGIAVGFGAQTVVKDVITGFFIIFENQFDVGDYVKINSAGATVAEGTVSSIGLRSTSIKTISGELTVLPNGSMGEVTNYSVIEGTSIVDLPIAVDEDIDKVETLLNEFLATLTSKYYLFVSAPTVLGVDDITRDQMTLRITAETIPGEGTTGARILRKELQRYMKMKNIKAPQPLMVQYDTGQQSNA